MANNNTTTNKVKKPIINNEEALRIITLIQQGDSQAENELAELGSVFIKAVAKQYVVLTCTKIVFFFVFCTVMVNYLSKFSVF